MVTVWCEYTFLGCSVTCPECSSSVNILLSQIHYNHCTVNIPCPRETIIVHLMIFMYNLNKARGFYFLPFQVQSLENLYGFCTGTHYYNLL